MSRSRRFDDGNLVHRIHELLLTRVLRKAPVLRAMTIEISSACNRTCSWCPNSITPRKKQVLMEEAVFLKAVQDAKAMGFHGRVTFNLYNEPLLDRRLVRYDRTGVTFDEFWRSA